MFYTEVGLLYSITTGNTL